MMDKRTGMKYTLKDFLSAVFNPDESTCFTADIKGVRVFPAFAPPPDACFVAINPLHPKLDLNPTAPYHFQDLPRRADINCVAYRTILCEFDKITLDEQLAFIEHTGLPVTTLTYSGGKSIHALLVLDQDVSREVYDRTVRKVFKALGNEVDIANKNPSRLSRLPGAVRGNGNTQDLISVRERIRLGHLEEWLENRGIFDAPEAPVQIHFDGILNERLGSGKVSENTMRFLMGTYEEGSWNIQLFKACCELFKKGNDYAQVVRMCEQITGHLDSRDINTLKSAQRTVLQSNARLQSSF